MRYKVLVSKKLEALENSVNRLNSLISQNLTRDQFQEVISAIKEKISEIQTLINVEQESL
jgi:hypothetical protein